MPQNDYYQTINSISFPSQLEGSKQELLKIAKQVEECATTIESRQNDIPLTLQMKFMPIISELLRIQAMVVSVNNTSNSADWNAVKTVYELFISDFYQLNDGSHKPLSGGFYICQSIINIVKLIDTSKSEFDEILQRTNELQQKSQVILDELQRKAGEEVAANYADIFLKDAKDLRQAANLWLACIIILIGCFIAFLIFEEQIIPLAETNVTTILTLSYVRRLLIISFLIFVITFVIKQYNVKMHLYTQNKHRSNTLSSYKLFIQSMGDSDIEARSQLMREVSKSIYDSGHTGYLNLKDDGENSSNTIINEITKIIKPGSDK